MQIYLRKYGTSASIDFDLYSTDGSLILTSAAFASGSCVISLDDGSAVNSLNIPIVSNNGFKLNLTLDELTCKSLHIKIKDTNINNSWLDTGMIVETYGTSASMHGDLASGLLDNLIDTIPLKQLLTEAISQLTGEFIRSGDAFTYYNRDGLTVSHSMSGSPSQRIRLD